MISERTLRNWRRDALREFDASAYEDIATALSLEYIEMKNRILRLTQELLDQHLVRKG